MNIMVKKPGKVEENKTVENTDEIFNIVAVNGVPEFVTFHDGLKIGMYLNDGGLLIGLKKNFQFSCHIIYGTVAFVGLSNSGRAMDLNLKQKRYIKQHLKRFSL